MPRLRRCHFADLRAIVKVLWPSGARYLLDDLLCDMLYGRRDSPVKLPKSHPPRADSPHERPRPSSKQSARLLDRQTVTGRQAKGGQSQTVDRPPGRCLLPAACCLLPAACCLLPAARCPLPAGLGLGLGLGLASFGQWVHVQVCNATPQWHGASAA